MVWTIAPDHAFLYLFPRDCPRILIWPKAHSSVVDQDIWLQGARRVAFVETRWMSRIRRATLYRYTLRDDAFRPLDDVGMYVADKAVRPTHMRVISGLPAALARADVALQPLPTLARLKRVWQTSLHASGIRLKNARDWH
ncbi:hypothetical protein SLH49_09825 [Cognatiyoonia sp. IB215446]|nr:DUF6886 family protein [Cognatiyoonia sp. IB215446]MDX8348286.1 hypothetical protein [Cognatiyoonia sp. IB215446]